MDRTKDAGITSLAAPGVQEAAPGRAARPVAGPPSADPLAATVDLHYELEDAGRALRPGQRVSVALPLKGEEESLVVPGAAILLDVHGGA